MKRYRDKCVENETYGYITKPLKKKIPLGTMDIMDRC